MIGPAALTEMALRRKEQFKNKGAIAAASQAKDDAKAALGWASCFITSSMWTYKNCIQPCPLMWEW